MSADDNIWRRGGSYGRRRGGRNSGRRGRGDRGFGRRPHPLSRLEDDDGDSYMDDNQRRPPQRYQPYTKRNDVDKSSVYSRLEPVGQSSRARGAKSGRGSWHKVTVLNGGSQSREWLIRTLKESISEPFQAVKIHQFGDKVMFFVEDSRAAEELSSLGKIQSKDGPLTLLVKHSDPPKGSHGNDSGKHNSARGRGQWGRPRWNANKADDDVLMDEDPTQVLTQVLGERFSTQTSSLNLTDMFHEQKFKERKIRASMFDQKFVGSILNLIGDHCPGLLALDLSNNRIQHLEAYTNLPTKCRNLKTLNLSNNEIHSLVELEHIQGMSSVTHLMLKNNPVSDQARDYGTYSSSVRKYFPNLECLDDQTLPSPVKFDLPVAVGHIPTYVKNHLPNSEVKVLVVKFLEEFFSLYDSDSREKLLEAYSDEALFSMSVVLPENQRDHYLQSYVPKSRNLVRVKDPAKRNSLLKHGRIDIVQFLRDLPRTKHQNELFEVDIIKGSVPGTETAFVVHGVFSEESERKEVLVRSFTRTFVIATIGTGVVILNDLLTITSASPKSTQFVQDNIGGSQNNPSIADMQNEAIRRLADATKMNFNYCNKCLSENNWDIDAAMNIFRTLQASGQIPAEAFL